MKFLILFFLLPAAACFSPPVPAKEELAEVMKNAKYDNEVFKNFALYKSLADFLKKNADTIIALANRKASEADKINPAAVGEYCFEFSYNAVAANSNIKDMPDFVYKQVNSLWKIVGENNISKIAVCSRRSSANIVTKTVTIDFKWHKAAHHTVVIEQLTGNFQSFLNTFPVCRDTALANNYIYRLGVAQDYSGW
jgi:hypothetical protein